MHTKIINMEQVVANSLTNSSAWRTLTALAAKEKVNIINELQNDPGRVSQMTKRIGDSYTVDLSKNLVNEKIMNALYELAKQEDLSGWIEKMFTGEQINSTEKRAVLHTALRNVSFNDGKFVANSEVFVDGENIMYDVVKVLNNMATFTDKVRSGEHKGYTGKPIKKVISIGIGGSDLGPKMATKALGPYAGDIELVYVSNVDGADLANALAGTDPETTMFIIESKTFTTQETMTNAEEAKRWFLEQTNNKGDIAKHFAASSTATDKVKDFGISAENMFPFWDWVGGRYSTPSAVGLPLMLSVGKENFADFLAGYHEMDTHFRTTDFKDNIPVQLALIGIWYNNFLGAESVAILPYANDLEHFPAYFQQGDMESNGKGVDRDGNKITDYQTGPIIWGEPGTNGQHAFYQLIHQGTKLIPVDFIAFANSKYDITGGDHQRKLLSNVFAQAEALAGGKSGEILRADGTPEELVSHKTFVGNKPTTTLLAKELSPKTLGMLISMYEHKIFTQGIIWRVLSFDQWGVQLGKEKANGILPELESRSVAADQHDASTTSLINEFFRMTNSELPLTRAEIETSDQATD